METGDNQRGDVNPDATEILHVKRRRALLLCASGVHPGVSGERLERTRACQRHAQVASAWESCEHSSRCSDLPLLK